MGEANCGGDRVGRGSFGGTGLPHATPRADISHERGYETDRSHEGCGVDAWEQLLELLQQRQVGPTCSNVPL